MTRPQFENLKVGDKVLHTIDGVFGKVYEVRPGNDGVRVEWSDGQRTYLDVTDPQHTHANVVPVSHRGK